MLECSCACNELYKRFSLRRSDLKYDSFYSVSLMKGEEILFSYYLEERKRELECVTALWKKLQ